MTVIHSAHLFDHVGFLKKAEPLVRITDAGDSEPVRQYAIVIIEQLATEHRQWALEDPWSNPLPDVESWTAPLTPEQIGMCFLVVLSGFLEPSPAGLLGDWPALHAGLTVLGWSEHDAQLLTTGRSIYSLLRPGRAIDPIQYAEPDLHHQLQRDWAWWVRPGYGLAGWLDFDTVSQLPERLAPLRARFAQLTPQQLRRDIYPTTGSGTSVERLLAAYDRVLVTLSTARQASKGLFITIA